MKSESETLSELFKALALAQSEMEAAATDATNPYFKSKYAKLEHVVKASRPFLSKQGLSVSQRPFILENGQRVLLTRLCHSSGEWMEGCMPINPPKEDIQAMGSYITYLRRYNYSCITGVVTEDESDDDGNKAKESQNNEKKEPIKKKNLSDDDLEMIFSSLSEMFKEEIVHHELLRDYLFEKRDKLLSTYEATVKWILGNKTTFLKGYNLWLETSNK